MDLELLLGCIVVLLIAVVVLLSILLYKVSEGVNRIAHAVGSIYLECNYPKNHNYSDDDEPSP